MRARRPARAGTRGRRRRAGGTPIRPVPTKRRVFATLAVFAIPVARRRPSYPPVGAGMRWRCPPPPPSRPMPTKRRMFTMFAMSTMFTTFVAR